MAESNRAVFNRPHVVAAYARAQQGPSGFLNLGEQTALIEAAPAARGRPVLDVGVAPDAPPVCCG